MQKVRLEEFFKCLHPKWLLGTTYTLSLGFFESVVWPTIAKDKLENCLILCDPVGYRRAMLEAGTLRDVGSRYFVIPVSCSGKFHPKVWIATNEEEMALLVGTGNLTQSGFVENVELFWAHRLRRTQTHGLLVNDLRLFFQGLSKLIDPLLPSGGLARSLLFTLMNNHLPPTDPALTSPRLFTSFHETLPVEMGKIGKGGTLYAASPYFGGDASGLNLLRKEISPATTHLYPGMMEEGLVDLDLRKHADVLMGVEVRQVGFSPSRTGEHFKLYGHAHPEPHKNWLYCGSANCTYPALTGKNVEAGILIPINSEDLATFFSGEKIDALPQFVQREPPEGSARCPVMFAAYVEGGLTLSIPSNNSLSLPLKEVQIEFRVGSRRAVAHIDTLFATQTSETVLKQAFDGELPSSLFASPYLQVTGKQASEAPFSLRVLIDDLLTLKAAARDKAASRAADAASRGEPPEIVDIIEYYRFIEGALDEGFLLGQGGGGKSKGGARDDKLDPDKIAVWPPEPVLLPLESSHSPDSDATGRHYYYWLDRIFGLFSAKKGISGPDRGEGEDNTNTPDPPPKSTRIPREWKEANARAENLRLKLLSMTPTAQQANCVYPTAILTHLMLLSIRTARAHDVEDPDLLMDSPRDIAAQLISTLYHDRVLPSGREDYSIAEVCHLKHDVPLFKQFAQDLITAFLELLICAEETFPFNSWLKFRTICGCHLKDFCDSGEIWARYERHFPWHERGMNKVKLAEHMNHLLAKEWGVHPGFKVARELIAVAAGKSEINLEVFGERAQEDAKKFQKRLHSGEQAVLRALRFSPLCTASRCRNRFIRQAKFEHLAHLEPVICDACGTAFIPDILFDVAREAV